MERDRDNFKSLEKFEKMIQDDNPVYLDLNELEEIIIYYFHDALRKILQNKSIKLKIK